MASDEENDEVVESGPDGTDPTAYLNDDSGPRADESDFVEPQDRVEGASTGGRYLIGETLGEGGMAVVHRATDVQLNRPVAVKRLRSELVHQQEARQRFFAEAEILAGLDHPGTTSVFEAGRLPDGGCYYAMKKVRGRTLGALLAERNDEDLDDRASRAHLVEIFIRVCQAVASAHNQGVIHRDLKPDNIMVDDLGVVYVMDWGLAKQLVEGDEAGHSDSERTRVGAVMGTPAYMSPEQASGHAATSDRQTDVFSLGVMLYEILTGVNPFRGESAVESMKGVMYHNPDPPRARNKRIDRTISAITMKAIDKDPFRRYRSAVEMAEDIRRYREFFSVSAIEPTAVEKVGNWSRRHPRMAAVAATLAVMLSVAALATAFEASLQNARVSNAYGFIDRIEADLSHIESEMASQQQALDLLPDGPERLAVETTLAELEAEFEVAEDERRSIAMAITGFTILSPDQRAITIIRESILDEIRTLIKSEEFFRARARIRVALRNAERQNVFGFSGAEHALLRTELEKTEREIEDAERARELSEAERPTGGSDEATLQ